MMGNNEKGKSFLLGEETERKSIKLNPSLGDLPNPGIEPRSPTLQGVKDSLLSEPLGKPENARVGSLSLLQGNFLTQESNQGLLHCKQIPYQLSYQGNPIKLKKVIN